MKTYMNRVYAIIAGCSLIIVLVSWTIVANGQLLKVGVVGLSHDHAHGIMQQYKKGEVILLGNGFGGTPLLELYVMVNAVRKVLAGAGVHAVRYLTGSYVTSLEMAGCSVTVHAADAAMLALWDAPVLTPTLRWGC